MAAVAAALLTMLLMVSFALLVFGMLCWVDLFVCAASSGDFTASWVTDMQVTGLCAVVFTALGGLGCWLVVSALARTVA